MFLGRKDRMLYELDKDDRSQLIMKEIDLLQGCITRMSHNSFLVKGWVLTIVVAVIALLPHEVNMPQALIRNTVLLCIAAFFILDSYNIFLERCYRIKYEWVIKNRDSSGFMFLDMSPKRRPVLDANGQASLEKFSLYRSLRRGISLPTVFFYGSLFLLMCITL